MNKSEKAFQDWLNSNQYPYLCIDQTPETFPVALRGISKRPDFFVIVKNFGMIAVDVKEHDNKRYKDFIIDFEEIIKYSEFEKIVRIPVWFVFGNYNEKFKSWYWIPLSKIQDCRTQLNKTTDQPFKAIEQTDCITLQAKIDGLERLLRD